MTFKAMAVEAAQKGSISAMTVDKVSRSPAFVRWAKSVGIENPGEWLTAAASPVGESVAQSANSDQKPYEALFGRY